MDAKLCPLSTFDFIKLSKNSIGKSYIWQDIFYIQVCFFFPSFLKDRFASVNMAKILLSLTQIVFSTVPELQIFY